MDDIKDVYVTNVTGVGARLFLWCQTDFGAYAEIETLMNDAEGEFAERSHHVDAETLVVGDVYLARYQADGFCYRAQVVAIHESTAQVFFFDFGNIETVEMKDIVKAPAKYFMIPPQAEKVILAGIAPQDEKSWRPEEIEKAKEYLVNFKLSCKVLQKSSAGNSMKVKLLDSEKNEDLVHQLVQDGIGKVSTSSNDQQIEYGKLAAKSSHTVFVTYSESPLNFWIQNVNSEQMDEIQNSIDDYLSSGPSALPLHSFAEGQVCLAKYNENEEFYRAVMTHIKGKEVTVTFIDYGNADTVKACDVLSLPQELLRYPAAAMHCCLVGEDVRRSNFNDIISAESLSLHVVSITHSGIHLVHFNTVNIVKDVGKVEAAQTKVSRDESPSWPSIQPLFFDLASFHDICISHVEQDGSFHCQLLENAPKLDNLMCQLQDAKLIPVKLMVEGMPCIGRSLVDQLCYRGKVISCQSDGASVNFVDFGVQENIPVKSIFELDENFTKCPVQCFKACLSNSRAGNTHIVSCLQKYNSTSALLAKVLFRAGQAYELELTDTSQGKNVKLSDLLSRCLDTDGREVATMEEVVDIAKSKPCGSRVNIPKAAVAKGREEELFVTCVYTGSQFFGQLTKNSAEELLKFQEKLQDWYVKRGSPVSSVQPGEFCCASFSEDEQYYRAQIVEQNHDKKAVQVVFVDYGNSEEKTVGDLMVLDSQFTGFPVQGIRCSLEKTKQMTAEQLEEILLEREVVVVPVQESEGTYEVSFPLNQLNKDICSKLAKYQIKTSPQTEKTTIEGSAKRLKAPDAAVYIETRLDSGTWEEVLVSHVEDSRNLFCQLLSKEAELNSLMEEIEHYAMTTTSSDAGPGKVYLGQPIIGKYSEDESWYRAMVTGVLKNGGVEVKFVDYGNTEVIQKADLRAIKPEFLKLECQAVKCSMLGVGAGDSEAWSQDHIDALLAAVDGKHLVALFRPCDTLEDMYTVDLFDGAVNINEKIGRALGKLTPGYLNPGPPPGVGNPARGKEETPVAKSSTNSWAKGFEESGSRRQQVQGAGDAGTSPGAGADSRRPILGAGSGGNRQASGVVVNGGSGRFGAEEASGARPQGGTMAPPRTPDSCDGARRSLESSRRSVERPAGPLSPGCQMPSVTPTLTLAEGAYMDVFVSYAECPELFWCQLQKEATELESLMDAINTEYGHLGDGDLVMERPSKAQVCCAKYSEDGLWYRGKVIAAKEHMVTVQFVDYGNSEDVARRDVRLLKPDYLEMPFQSFRCSLKDIAPAEGSVWGEVAITKFQEFTLEEPLVTCIVGKKGDTFVVELIRKSQPVDELLVNANVAKYLHSSPVETRPLGQRRLSASSAGSTSSLGPRRNSNSSQVSSSSVQVKPLSLRRDRFVDVCVSFVNSPDEFWCQLTETSSQLNELTNKLIAIYGKLAPGDMALADAAIGKFCCALYEEDKTWYRASVSKINGPKVEVQFIDYGNAEWVNAEMLKQLDASLKELPAQAVRCGLHGLNSRGRSWDATEIASFEELTLDKNLLAKVLSRGQDDLNVVQLVDVTPAGEIQVLDLFNKATGTGVPDARPAESSPSAPSTAAAVTEYLPPSLSLDRPYRALMSWINTPLDFYVQLESSGEKLNRQTEEMFDFYQCLKMSEKAVRDPTIGQPCVAYFDEDGNWYRSLITKLRPNQALVQYVDYGNKSAVNLSRVKELCPQFAELPRQAVKCTLDGVEPPVGNEWPVDVQRYFGQEVSGMLTVKFLSNAGDAYVVDVTDRQNDSVTRRIKDLLNPQSGKSGETKPTPQASPKVDLAPESTRASPSVEKAPQVKTSATTAPAEENLRYRQELMTGDKPEAVTVSNIEGPNRFWCQKSGKVPALDDFMLSLESHYSGLLESALQPTSLVPDKPCVAKFTEDDYWYRGQITKVNSPQEALVFFVDYGNSEAVAKNRIKQLQREFAQLETQAIECSLHGLPATITAEGGAEFSAVTVGKTVTAQTVKVGDGGVHQVKLMTAEGRDVSQLVLEKCGASASASATLDGKAQLKFSQPSVPDGKVPVYVSSVGSPSGFYVQLVAQESELESFSTAISDKYEKMSPEENRLPKVEIGEPCCARYSEDGLWYRGSVAAVNGDDVSVIFVDYGNEESCPRGELKTLQAEDIVQAPYAIHCKLHGAPDASAWSEADLDKLEAEDAAPKYVQFMNHSSGLYQCEMFVGDEPLAASYRGTAPAASGATAGGKSTPTPAVIPSGSSVQAYLSHVDNPGEFYVQPCDTCEKLDALMGELEAVDRGLVLKNPSCGELCGAVYAADGALYRAVVRSAGADSFDVHYVDYGNAAAVSASDLIQLPPHLAESPLFAVRCCLDGVAKPAAGWPAAAAEKLQALAEEAEKELTVTFRSSAEPCPVTLLDGEEDIGAAIKALVSGSNENATGTGTAAPTEAAEAIQDARTYPEAVIPDGKYPVSVSHVNSPSEIYLQLAKDSIEVERLLDLVDEKYGAGGDTEVRVPVRLAPGADFCAKSPADGVWYRAQVVNLSGADALVRFVDYGDTSTVEQSALRPLTAEMAEKPAMAFPCCLDGAESGRSEWPVECVDKLHDMTHEKILAAELYTEGGRRYVKLSDKDQSISAAVLGLLPPDGKDDRLTQSEVDLKPGTKVEARISHVINPGDFWCQLRESRLVEITDSLATCGEQPELEAGEVRDDCLYAVRSDGEWYRARVVEASGEKTRVFFIDCGLTDVVPSADIRALTEGAKLVPAQALRCTLAGICCRGASGWSEAAVNRFQQLVGGKTSLLEVVDLPEDRRFAVVKLLQMGISVAESLLAEGHGSESDAVSPPGAEPTVSPGEGAADLRLSPEKTAEEADVDEDDSQGAFAGKKLDFGDEGEGGDGLGAGGKVATVPVGEPLAIRSKLEVYVTHADSPGEFWIQGKAAQSALESLVEKMQEFYENNLDNKVDRLQAGQTVAAMSEEDSAWYRARVLDDDDDDSSGSIRLRFVDYGNCESVPRDNIQTLAAEFCASPPMAYHCALAGVAPLRDEAWGEAAVESFSQLTKDKCMVAEVVQLGAGDGGCTVNLLDMGLSVAATMISREHVQGQTAGDDLPAVVQDVGEPLEVTAVPSSAACSSEDSEGQMFSTYQWPELIEGDLLPVFVSAAESPRDFWCQLAKTSTSELPLLQDQIQDFYSREEDPLTREPLEPLDVGSPCVAKYDKDVWYRAQVTKVKDAEVDVCFVDYGNFETVERGSVRAVSEELMRLPRQAFHCALHGVSHPGGADGRWDETSCNRFQELVVLDEPREFALKVERLVAGMNALEVEGALRDGDSDIGELLVDGGYARRRGVGAHAPGNKDEKNEDEPREEEEAERGVKAAVTGEMATCVEKIVEDIIRNARAEVEAREREVTQVEASSTQQEAPSTQQEAPPTQEKATQDEAAATEDGTPNEATATEDRTPNEATATEDRTPNEATATEDRTPNEATATEDRAPNKATATEDGTPNEATATEDRTPNEATATEDGTPNEATATEDRTPNEATATEDRAPNEATATEDGTPTQPDETAARSREEASVSDKPSADPSDEGVADVSTDSDASLDTAASDVPQEDTDGNLKDPEQDIPHEVPADAKDEEDFQDALDEEADALCEDLVATTLRRVSLELLRGFANLDLEVGVDLPVKYLSGMDRCAFWIQLDSAKAELDVLMTDLAAGCSSTVEEGDSGSSAWEIGQVCLVKDPTEQRCYRAALLAITEDVYKVQYVDYGLRKEVAASCLHPLGEAFLSLPRQAVPCRLTGLHLNEWNERAATEFQEMCLNKELTLRVLTKEDSGVHVVELFDSAELRWSINQQLIDLGFASGAPDGDEDSEGDQRENSFLEFSLQKCSSFGDLAENEAVQEEDDQAFLHLKYTPGSAVDVTLISVKDPDNILCRPKDSSESLEQLLKSLQDTYADHDIPAVDSPTAGQPCCAVVPPAGRWQRAQVMEILEETLNLYCVDVGRTETIPSSEVRILEQRFLELPAQAVRCSLADASPVDEVWMEEGEWLVSQCGGEGAAVTLSVDSVDDDGNLTVRITTSDGRDLTSLLKERQEEELTAASERSVCGDMTPSLYSLGSQDSVNQTKEGTPEADSDDEDLATSLGTRDFVVGQKYDVTVTHCGGLDHVWCQLKGSEVDTLMARLQDIYNTRDASYHEFEEGNLCAVKFTDSTWYRGRVESGFEGLYTVQAVDFGTSEIVVAQNMHRLLAEFAQQPSFAVDGSLADVRRRLEPDESEEDWLCRVSDFVTATSTGAEVVTLSLSRAATDDQSPLVSITCDGRDLAESLVAHGVAVKAVEEPTESPN